MPYPYYTPYAPIYNQPQMQMPVQQTQQVQPQQTQMQMQNGGFMSMPTEQDARNYPVAPGNVMTFKIENQPYVCEKAQGFSQLEGPVFTKYRLVKEDVAESVIEHDDFNAKEEIEKLRAELKELKDKMYAKNRSVVRNNDKSDRGGYKRDYDAES